MVTCLSASEQIAAYDFRHHGLKAVTLQSCLGCDSFDIGSVCEFDGAAQGIGGQFVDHVSHKLILSIQ
jgi:hypothetical protein